MSVDTQTDEDGPDIPERAWENPYLPGTPMHDLFARRVRENRDLVIILDDYHAGRGTGKTIASMQLGNGMDQNGGLTHEKAVMDAELLRDAYSGHPKRSGLVLDEGEQAASNRNAMTKVNKALREIMSMGRVEEKYIIINTPSVGFIDKDIRLLADVWMTMLARGIALVHFLKRQPYARQLQGKLLTEKEQIIEFRDIKKGTELRDVYNSLTREKQKRIAGDRGGGFIPHDEHEEILERQLREARQHQRDNIIHALAEHPQADIPQTVIADVVDLSPPRVNQILRGSS